MRVKKDKVTRKILALLFTMVLWLWSLASAVAKQSPTTGREIGEERLLPVLVSISNTEGKAKDGKKTIKAAGIGISTQWGLQDADILYEQLLYNDNGATRFVCVFHDALLNGRAVECGPVRSCRPGQMLLREEWRGVLIYRGMSWYEAGISDRFSKIDDLLAFDTWKYGRCTTRNASVYIQDNVTAHLQAFLALAPAGSISAAKPFAFATQAGTAAALPQCEGVRLKWGKDSFTSSFEYDENTQTYLRYSNGVPSMTYLSEEKWGVEAARLSFENVIIQLVPYVLSGGNANCPVPQLIGEGEAWVLTGGRLIACRWIRESDDAVSRLIDTDGKPVALRQGRTYIAHFPSDMNGIEWLELK